MSKGGGNGSPRGKKRLSDRERRRRSERRARAAVGNGPRVRWSGANLEELAEFVAEHGSALDAVDRGAALPPLVFVVEPYTVIHPGRWLERDLRYDAGDPRGWKTHVS